MPIFKKLRLLGKRLKRELVFYRVLYSHRQTPFLAKALLWAALGYVMLPFDLIPDFIPVIGHIDDLVIVPLLLLLALKMIPAGVIEECRAKATNSL